MRWQQRQTFEPSYFMFWGGNCDFHTSSSCNPINAPPWPPFFLLSSVVFLSPDFFDAFPSSMRFWIELNFAFISVSHDPFSHKKKKNVAHFSLRWSLGCQLRWRRCRRSTSVPSWTRHQAVSRSTSPSLWHHWQTSRRTVWTWQQWVWDSAWLCETPTTGTGHLAPWACLSGDTPCKWSTMITSIKLEQDSYQLPENRNNVVYEKYSISDVCEDSQCDAEDFCCNHSTCQSPSFTSSFYLSSRPNFSTLI